MHTFKDKTFSQTLAQTSEETRTPRPQDCVCANSEACWLLGCLREVVESLGVSLLRLQRVAHVVEQLGVVLVDAQRRPEERVLRRPVVVAYHSFSGMC